MIPWIRINGELSEEKISIAFDKLSWSLYKKKVKQDEAPNVTNCVTFVRYAILEWFWVELPKWWIWDLPKIIVQEKNIWTLVEKIKNWDIIFLRRREANKKYPITHCWIYFKWKIYHSSHRFDTICNTIGELLKIYEIVPSNKLLEVSDPRNFIK